MQSRRLILTKTREVNFKCSKVYQNRQGSTGVGEREQKERPSHLSIPAMESAPPPGDQWSTFIALHDARIASELEERAARRASEAEAAEAELASAVSHRPRHGATSPVQGGAVDLASLKSAASKAAARAAEAAAAAAAAAARRSSLREFEQVSRGREREREREERQREREREKKD